MKTRKLVLSAFVLAILLSTLTILSASAAPPTPTAPQQHVVQLHTRGTTSLSTAMAVETLGKPDRPADTQLALKRIHAANRPIPRYTNSQPSLTAPAAPPETPGLAVVTTNPNFGGFNALNHLNSRAASGGNQWSLEPPDQGLCVGRSFVLEAVNAVVRVYGKAGGPLTAPIALNQFLGFAPAINRSTGVYGPSLGDPKCYYDPDTDRWFLTTYEQDVDPGTGDYLAHTEIEIAVSRTGDPRGAWNLFAIITTNDGTEGTPTHPNCPCFPDQPLIGADLNGFYISINEYPSFTSGFNGAVIYALNKRALGSGAITPAIELVPGLTYPAPDPACDLNAGVYCWYSLQPAISPNKVYELANKGTEYFMSALDFAGAGDTRIAAWALTNTASLRTTEPNLNLQYVLVGSQAYGTSFPVPFVAEQKAGPTPLGTANGESLEKIDANDDRMNQVVFANGQLWSGLNTLVHVTGDTADRVGIAYFVVNPGWDYAATSPFGATMAQQGYVAAKGNHVLFPSIGVTDAGKGAMVFTLSGTDYYPSMAYTRLTTTSAPKNIRLGAAGKVPEDGFTGYPSLNSAFDGGSRWGDYSAAVASGGRIWVATEYVPRSSCNAALTVCTGRTVYGNWGTFIGSLLP